MFFSLGQLTSFVFLIFTVSAFTNWSSALAASLTIQERVALLNSSKDYSAKVLSQVGLGRDTDLMKVHPDLIIALTDYLLRTASGAVPSHGGDSLPGLSFDTTRSIVDTLLKMPINEQRDRAVIIYWSFLNTASTNFRINTHEFHHEKSNAISRLGVAGKKLYIQSLLAANWTYTGFGAAPYQGDLFESAFNCARDANLLNDPEIRGLFESHFEKAHRYVTDLLEGRINLGYATRHFWTGSENPKALPTGFVNQVSLMLSYGLPKNSELLTKLKLQLQETVLPTQPGGRIDGFYSSRVKTAEEVRKFALTLISALEKPDSVEALRALILHEGFSTSANGLGSQRIANFLFNLEMKKPGLLSKLMRTLKNEQEIRHGKHRSRLYAIPPISEWTPDAMTTLLEMRKLGLVADYAFLDFILKFDLIQHNRELSYSFLKLMKSKIFEHSELKDLVVNRSVLAILNGRLNATQATYLAAALPEAIGQSVEALRLHGTDLGQKRYSNGNEFRKIFQGLTLATLFAKESDFRGNQLASRMPVATTLIEILQDLDSGSRQRGSRFDAVAKETKDRLFIRVALALQAGDKDALEIFSNEVAALKNGVFTNARYVDFNLPIAEDAVEMVTTRLTAEQLAKVRVEFGQLIDREALAKFAGIELSKTANLEETLLKKNICKGLF